MDPTTENASDSAPPAPLLTAVEARILGCLVEKQATTPDVYPLTLNAVVAACNQKSNRDPLMELEPGAVGHALRELEGRGFVLGTMSARASRYEHRMDQALGITPRQRAVLAALMLRGPQTLSELYVRCERLADFPNPDELRATLDRLAQRTPALAVRVPRGGGQREDRYAHLLCGAVDVAAVHASDAAAAAPREDGALAARVATLESRIDELQELIDTLRVRLDAAGG